MRFTQKPTIENLTQGPYKGDEISTHPAFGVISASRWQSSYPVELFGSSMKHRAGITLTVSQAKSHRSLSADHQMECGMVAKITFSESQWVRLISSVGNGPVPVTLETHGSFPLVTLPSIESEKPNQQAVFAEDLRKSVEKELAEMQAKIDALGEMIDSGKTGKKDLKELHRQLNIQCQNLPANTAFVQNQFSRSTSKLVDDAKTEIEAHIDGIARRVGFDALRASMPILGASAGEVDDPSTNT